MTSERYAERPDYGATETTVRVESLAKWLAWADRANDSNRPAKFKESADRYWNEHAAETLKGRWLALAAGLLGVEFKNFDDWRRETGS